MFYLEKTITKISGISDISSPSRIEKRFNTVGWDFQWTSATIWGSEVYVTEKNFAILFKYLSDGDEKRKELSSLIEKVVGKKLADEWWHSDDDRLQKVFAPLKLNTLAGLEMLRTGKSIDTIRTEVKHNNTALAAWDIFFEGVNRSSVGLDDDYIEEESDDE